MNLHARTATRRRPPTAEDIGVPETSVFWFGLSPRLVVRVLLPLSVVLAVVSLVVRAVWYSGSKSGLVGVLMNVVDVDREGSIPSWVSTLVLAACAASLWTVAEQVRARGERWSGQWRLLAFAFAYLSLDEVASLHERAIEPVRHALDLSGAFYYAWVVVAIPLVIVLGLALLPFLRALPRWSAVAFLVCGAVYVGGAAGMEMVGGVVASAGGADTLGLHAVVTVEELLELVGATLFLAVVNEHRRRFVGSPTGGVTDLRRTNGSADVIEGSVEQRGAPAGTPSVRVPGR